MVGRRVRTAVARKTTVAMVCSTVTLGLVVAPAGVLSQRVVQRIVAAQPASAEFQRVAVDVKRAPLAGVLQNIARQAGLVLVYDDAVMRKDLRVTLKVRNVAAEDAFEQALRGTGLVARIHSAGDVVIARHTAAPTDGGVTGQVLDRRTKQPIANVTVTVEGSKIATTTDEKGNFTLSGIPAGPQRLRFRRIGYRGAMTILTVKNDSRETITVDMETAPTELSRVVTTASGERARLETGNSVGVIQADSVVSTALIRNVSDLLTARTPGVVVQNPSGLVGAPSRIRIRGLNSLQLNNDPIVILDGIRLPSQTTQSPLQANVSDLSLPSVSATGIASTAPLQPSRLDDIDPNSIESIDVLRGPSAAAQYGPDASNGVIVIKTKRGRPGPWRVTLNGDQGWSRPRGDQTTYWYGWQTNANGAGEPFRGCTLADVGATYSVENGTCHIDSVTHYTPLADPRLSNIGTGKTQNISGTLSGGNDQLRQSVTGTFSNRAGVLRMSDVQQRLIAELWDHAVPSWMTDPNTQKSYSVSSRTDIQGGSLWDVSLTAMGSQRNLITARPGYSNLESPRGPGDSLSFLPGLRQRERVSTNGTHGTGMAQANLRPFTWLRVAATGGGDFTQENSEDLLRAQDCTPIVDQSMVNGRLICPSGRSVRRRQTFQKTGTLSATLTTTPFGWLKSDTWVSEMFSKINSYALSAGSGGNADLAFGSNLLTPIPLPRRGVAVTADEARDAQASGSWAVNQTFGVRGTMFISSGFSRDAASAIGSRVNERAPFYPKVNASWLLSNEGFFPKNHWLPTLRLRGAHGRSGNQPSQAAILGSFAQTGTLYDGMDAYGIQLTAVGNPNLRPERSTETEFGFDGSLLDNERITFGFSAYRKHTDDQIVSVILPLSFGLSTASKTVNVGSTENHGSEFETTIRVLDRQNVALSLSVNASVERNKLTHKDPSFQSDDHAYEEGYPLLGYWGYPILSYADRNNDHILARSEITLGSAAFMGAPYPKSSLGYSTNLVLFGGLSFNANVSQVNGQANRYNIKGKSNGGRALVDSSTSIAEQAGAIQAFLQNGYINTYTAIRLNEASVSYALPARIARRLLHVASANIGLTGRNLGLWTNYAGNDPNVDQAARFNEQQTDDGTGLPQPREWTIRFNLGF